MRYVSNHSSATEFILARREFNGSSMRGRTTPNYEVGRLPEAWRDVYYHTANDIDYIVYSFATPIAWHTRDGLWFVPSVTYSGYSSRHQWYARRAAMTDNTFKSRIECDRYYTSTEIMAFVHQYRETGDVTIHHTNRQYAYVTVRGIKPGDYVMSETGWRTVYGTERVKGVFGSYYWRAITVRGGEMLSVYIGDATERVARLR